MSAPVNIFRFPAGCPDLTYESLRRYIGDDRHAQAMIGRTVQVTHWPAIVTSQQNRVAQVTLRLYGTSLAVIMADSVLFTVHGDRHQATREWLGKIIADNGLGVHCFRTRTGYVPGVGSPLHIDGDPAKPVEGHSYTVKVKASTQ